MFIKREHQNRTYTVTHNGKVINSGGDKDRESLVQWMRIRGYWNTNTNHPNPGYAINMNVEIIGVPDG